MKEKRLQIYRTLALALSDTLFYERRSYMKQICSFLIVLFLLIHLSSCNTILPPAETDPTGETTEETAESTTEEETVAPEWVDAWTPTTPRYFQGLESDPWYFSWDPRDSVIVYMRDYRSRCDLGGEIALKTPLRYEVSESNLLFRFEFFQEYHLPGAMMQLRITVINCGEAYVYISDHASYATDLRVRFPNWSGGGRPWFSPDEAKQVQGGYQHFTLQPGRAYSFDRILTLPWNERISKIEEGSLILEILVNETPITVSVPVQTVDSAEAPELPEGDVVTEAPSINHNWVNEYVAIEPVELPDLDGRPWYFSWSPNGYQKDYLNVYPVEGKVALKTPLRYEIAQPGLILRFEFFEEYHLPGSILQVRMTMINNSDAPILISSNAGVADSSISGSGWGEDGRGILSIADQWALHADDLIFSLYPGESYSFERVFRLPSKDSMNKTGDATLCFWMGLKTKYTEIKCPLELISAGRIPS